MSDQSIDTPQALDGAIAIRVRSRREALLHDARGDGIHLLDVLLGLAVVCVSAALFLEQRWSAALSIGLCLSVVSIYAVRTTRQLKAVCSLLEMEKPL
jgi:hypothetical protein